MYTYNKNDKTYTFSSDELEIESLVDVDIDKDENKEEQHEKKKNIEVINGGNDLDISPVTDYLEDEKPKQEKRENIIIPKDNK